jgi:hypothetical protein
MDYDVFAPGEWCCVNCGKILYCDTPDIAGEGWELIGGEDFIPLERNRHGDKFPCPFCLNISPAERPIFMT